MEKRSLILWLRVGIRRFCGLRKKSLLRSSGNDVEGCVRRGHDEGFDREGEEGEVGEGSGAVNDEARWEASSEVTRTKDGIWERSGAVIVFRGDEVSGDWEWLALG